MSSTDPIRICLGYPAYSAARYAERLRAIDPRVLPSSLPVDSGSDWIKVSPGEPHDEPPPWAVAVADERRRMLEQAEVLLALQTPKNLMSLAPRMRWLQGVGAGVEQFVAAGVRRDQVTVTNASGVSAGSMAEFVIARLLQIWKRFPEAERHQRSHEYVQTYGRTFAGCVLGIIGMGSIGCAVAERARALGVRVLGMKRSQAAGPATELAERIFDPSRLHEMLALCDAVVVTAPATPETFHLLDTDAFAATRRGAVLVNVARGSLVDEAALVEALASGQLAAAALDVFEKEPLPSDSPLWDVPNLYVSAHSSVSVDRYLDDVFDLFADNVTRYVTGEPLRNVVDMQALGFE